MYSCLHNIYIVVYRIDYCMQNNYTNGQTTGGMKPGELPQARSEQKTVKITLFTFYCLLTSPDRIRENPDAYIEKVLKEKRDLLY